MSARLRPLLGPCFAGAAAWCALGRVTVASPDDIASRLASPAPWWSLLACVVVSALVPAWRRRPALAAPALLATLPWWPVPMPAVALLWTEHLAWLPVGLALLAAVASSRGWLQATGGPSIGIPSGSAVRAAALTFVLAAATAWSVAPRVPGGDEPNYLVITQSLLKDGDLRVENNYDRRDYQSFYSGELPHDWLQRGIGGVAYSVHAPGVPVLVLPAFALAGYRGAQLTIMLIAALTGGLVWAAAWLATRDRGAAWFAWAAVACSATFLIQAVTIFPDGPGAFAVACGVWLLMRLDDRLEDRLEDRHDDRHDRSPERVHAWTLVGVSVALAALPWLHTRFVVLAAALGLLIVLRLTRMPAGVAPRWSWLWFLAVPAASAVAWFAYFKVIYGTFNPSAPYGPNPDTRLAWIPGGLAGLLFDGQFGLLTYAPVLALAIVGVWRRREVAAALLYVAAAAAYWMWWAGVPAPPARLLAAALPALAVPLAAGWKRSSAVGRAVWLALLGVTLATSALVIGIDRGAFLWNAHDTPSAWFEWLTGVVALQRAWPDFFRRLTPLVLSSEWPFFRHVVLWIACAAVVAAFLSAARRRGWLSRTDPAVIGAWTVPLLLMGLTQIGWAASGGPAVDPAASQCRLLAEASSGTRLWAIAPGRIRPVADPAPLLRIRAIRSDVPDGQPASWEPLGPLPPGTYDVTVVSRRPTAGAIALRVGDSRQPWRDITLSAVAEQTIAITLPVGIADLAIEPDAALASAARRIDVRPAAVPAARDRRPLFADREAVFGGAQVYVFDGGAYLEDRGFWVRGGEAAELAVVPSAGRGAVSMTLTNGPDPNTVEVTVDDRVQVWTLTPSERRTLSVASGGAAPAIVRIRSRGGFRPSDRGSNDRRYLGVRVDVGE